MGNNVNDLRKLLSYAEGKRDRIARSLRDLEREARMCELAARSQRKAKAYDQAKQTEFRRSLSERDAAECRTKLANVNHNIAKLNAQIKKCR